jgi:hypothetical protein
LIEFLPDGSLLALAEHQLVEVVIGIQFWSTLGIQIWSTEPG